MFIGLEDLFAGLTLTRDQANTLIRAIEMVTDRGQDPDQSSVAIPPTPTPSPAIPPTTPARVSTALGYHVPDDDAKGPFYVVTCGLDIGIFSG